MVHAIDHNPIYKVAGALSSKVWWFVMSSSQSIDSGGNYSSMSAPSTACNRWHLARGCGALFAPSPPCHLAPAPSLPWATVDPHSKTITPIMP